MKWSEFISLSRIRRPIYFFHVLIISGLWNGYDAICRQSAGYFEEAEYFVILILFLTWIQSMLGRIKDAKLSKWYLAALLVSFPICAYTAKVLQVRSTQALFIDAFIMQIPLMLWRTAGGPGPIDHPRQI